MGVIGVLVGMRFEARILERAFAFARHGGLEAPRIAVSGASLARAEEGARRLAENGVSALLSFGTAGALDPGLRPGDLIIPDYVRDITRHDFAVDLEWATRLKESVPDTRITSGPLLSTETAIASPEEKARLRQETGAVAVDTESVAVARAAAAYTLPFIAVRVVLDTAHRALPTATLHAVRADGAIRLRPVLASLIGRPNEIGVLLALAGNAGRARRTLRRVGLRSLPLLIGP